MTIEWCIKHKSGRGSDFGENWEKHPSIRIMKGAVYLNIHFQQCFDVTDGDYVCVGVDSRNGRVVFKKSDSTDPQSYPARASNKARTPSSLRVNCATPGKKFPDRIGDTIRARLNRGELVIEADMSRGDT